MKINPKNPDFPSCKKLGLKNGDTVDFVEFDGFDYRVSHAKNIIIADSDGYYFDISRCSRKDSDYSGYCSYIPISNIFAINGVTINNPKATNILVSITENELKKVKEEEKEIYNMFENKYKSKEIKMQNLKIKIKEVVEERRKLTEDEKFIFSLNNGTGYAYLQSKKGWQPLSRIADETYLFDKETIRDATEEELRAYHMIELSKVGWIYMPSGWRYDITLIDKMKEIFKGKEIILEIE